MLTESDVVTKEPNVTIEILGKVTSLLFGLNKENVNPDLYRTAYGKICETFIGCTVQDIRNAYNNAVIEKKAYTTLTRDELIQPIKDYWLKRQIVLSEFKKVESKVVEEINVKEKAIVFKTEAQQKYLHALNSDCIWRGTDIEAHQFARNFKDMFSQEDKDLIWKKAKEEFFKQLKSENNPILAEFNKIDAMKEKRCLAIYSGMIVQEALNRNFNLIID
jgi:hypothetical protein